MNQKEECITGICFWARDLNRAQGEVLMEYKYKLYDFLRTDFYIEKHCKGNLEGILEVVEEAKKRLKKEKAEARISRSTIYDIIAIGEKYPTQEKLERALVKENKVVNWTSALTLIRPESRRLEQTSSCRHCLTHCPKI